jgi:hypothetical protein
MVLVQIDRFRGLPFDAENPLVFHMLTSGTWGGMSLSALVKSDAVLAPARDRAGAPAHAGYLVSDDVKAGDDRLLFFSVGVPCRGWDIGAARVLAFDLRDLFQSGHVGWRIGDFLSLYLDRITGEGRHLTENIERVARCATVWVPDDVRRLCLLTMRLMTYRMHGHSPRGGCRAAQRAIDGMRRVVKASVCKRVDRLDVWKQLFAPTLRSLERTFCSPSGDVTPEQALGFLDCEVVLEGRLPLSRARYVHDEDGWRPVQINRNG